MPVKSSLPPIPDEQIAASAALRKRMADAKKQHKIRYESIAARSGFSRVTIQNFASGRTQIGPHPHFYSMVSDAIDALIRDRLARALAKVDPEFAVWDAPRRAREQSAVISGVPRMKRLVRNIAHDAEDAQG